MKFLCKLLNLFPLAIFLFFLNVDINAQQTGIVKGNVVEDGTGNPLQYINVFIKSTSLGDATDKNGNFRIAGLDPGKYELTASGIGYTTANASVTVEAGKEVEINLSLKIESIDVGEVVVYGASLRKERITEAPAAISVIEAKEIERFGGHGQLAKLLEMEPGVDIAQNGLFDFNVNTRGFNSSLNRRLLILLDGRDVGTAFLGATEWNGLSTPLEELGRLELIRGPGSALYGANAFNGVINISSIKPADKPGTKITLSGGEKESFRGDIRYAAVRGKLSYRFNVGGFQGKSFAVPRKGIRNASGVLQQLIFEYDGLSPINNENYELNTGAISSVYGAGRIDYDYGGGKFAVIEGGMTQVVNETMVTGIGRVQVQKANKPFVRLNYNTGNLSILLWSNGRKNILPEKSLATGLDLVQDAWITHSELQYSFNSLQEKLFVVLGASQRMVNIDTKGTLMVSKRDDNMTGIFAQAEYKFLADLKGVVAARWDRSSLHESAFSPKVALVYNLAEGHSIRGTYNKAFQAPNYSELYLNVKAPPTSGPLYNSSNFYKGNNSLKTEKITGYEIGYKGVLFNNSVFVTADFYFNNLKDFITDLGPTGKDLAFEERHPIDTTLRWRKYAIWSYGNAGEVDEYGYEIGVNYYPNEHWVIDANYSQFNFEIIKKDPKDYLLPNSPKYKMNFGVTYLMHGGHDISVKVKYVPSFPWAAGIFRDADVPAYAIVNLAGTYQIMRNLSLNLNVTNLLDRKHFEILGGSLLGRRALATLSYSI